MIERRSAGLEELAVGPPGGDHADGQAKAPDARRQVEAQPARLASDPHDAIIVRSTVALARNLGLRVVAVGVESAAALDLLADYGCHLAQGYHLSHPLPATAITEWLSSRTAQINPAAPPTRL